MSVHDFQSLRNHIGHKIVCVRYGQGNDVQNVALECEDCGEVLLDYDAEPEPEPEPKAPTTTRRNRPRPPARKAPK